MNVIYPGSFDPITYGHLDIIKRCSSKFDKVIVGVLSNSSKKVIFTIDERVELIRKCTKELKNVEVDSFSGLLIDFAKQKNCPNIVRGLRAVSDFEYEMQMALVNRKLYPELETYFMVSGNQYSFLSSSIVKEIAMLNGNISCFVPKVVEEKLVNKIRG
ncbi:pantetheine-phosphate adenylyltransferase [Paratissierella segnis]|uniref:Phosphopantetheine adenylyltransferase n=1 Tax=Paratissierella segnis TaxID=2763679 RepID=A0A926EY98_9FIRM|nr:pantetheine-phosphate adenylyltransferase [Paratissierella segnis]MBC8588619.1 pantetheine-phosphate adenylyltransferase [Paratissierella segnis]